MISSHSQNISSLSVLIFVHVFELSCDFSPCNFQFCKLNQCLENPEAFGDGSDVGVLQPLVQAGSTRFSYHGNAVGVHEEIKVKIPQRTLAFQISKLFFFLVQMMHITSSSSHSDSLQQTFLTVQHLLKHCYRLLP